MNAPDPVGTVMASEGVVRGLPAETYHAIESMSASGAKKMLRSPLHYKLMRDQPSKPTEAMQFGTAVHDGVLEPDTFAHRVVEAPAVNKRTNAGKIEWAEFCTANTGRIVLDAADMACARACIDAVRAHPAAAKLLHGAEVESSFFWRDAKYGVPCKSRWDARNHGGIIDLKTCEDASSEAFQRSIGRFLYHLQAAFYFSGAEHVLNETPSFFAFIAVESEPPHAVACYQLDAPSIFAGANLADEALRRYAAALESGRFDGYASTIGVINAPRWALRDFY